MMLSMTTAKHEMMVLWIASAADFATMAGYLTSSTH